MCKLAIGAMLVIGTTAGAIARADDFRLSSPDVAEGGRLKTEQVSNAAGCHGGNVSPALSWSGAPAGTQSFAVTMFDPDAEVGVGRWHWIIYDIPATATGLPKNAGAADAGLAPVGSVQGESDFDEPGYGGPCPPRGDEDHRYIFKAYALDVAKLPTRPDSVAIPLHLHFHSLAQATLTGLYRRPGRAYAP